MRKLLALFSLMVWVAHASVTPNMGLDKPVIGQPNYALKIDTILNQIDTHDHTTRHGVQIPSGGLADGAVTTTKLAASAVTAAAIAAGAVTSTAIHAGAVGNAQLGLQAVTTQNIASNSILISQMAPVISGPSTGVGNLTLANFSLKSVTGNVQATLIGSTLQVNTIGRPVLLSIGPDNGADIFQCYTANVTGTLVPSFDVWRDFVPVFRMQFGITTNLNPTAYPCSTSLVDFPSAGPHTYQLVLTNGTASGQVATVNAGQFSAFEL